PGSSLINGQGPLGTSVFDTATLTAPVTRTGRTDITPTGTVTYTFTGAGLDGLTPPPGWTANPDDPTIWTQEVTLNANGMIPNSAATPPLPAGTDYVFTATYSGDDNFQASTSPREPLTINQGTSTTETVIVAAAGSPPLGTLGGQVFDTATVTVSPAAFPPTGTVT